MAKRSLTLLAAFGVALAFASCSRELKPDKKGIWLASGGRLIPAPAAAMETEFTAEGFATDYFTAEPTLTLKTGDYFILYGDYAPFALRVFKRHGSRYEEDTSKGSLTDVLQKSQFRGEKEMYHCKMTKPLGAGTYVLDLEHAGAKMAVAFQVQF
jgi:hypothetical protein